MATPTDKKKQPYTPLANQPSVGERGFGQTHQHMKTGPNATDDSRHAYNLVESEFGPSRTASMQQLSRLGSDRQYEQGIQENFGQVHDQTLQEIAQQLQQQLGGVTDRVQGLHKGASSVIGDAYGRAQGATQGRLRTSSRPSRTKWAASDYKKQGVTQMQSWRNNKQICLDAMQLVVLAL